MSARARRYAPAVVALAGALLLGAPVSKGDDYPPVKIDWETARRLAVEAYDHGIDQHFFWDDHITDWPPFFVIWGYSPPPGVAGFGFFAVNPWTGDVWSLWECRKLSTSALRKSQAIIRRRFTQKELGQYKRLAAIKPECV